MKTDIVKIESGEFTKITYTIDDVADHGIPNVISDIMKSIPDFDGSIEYLKIVKPNDGYDIGDVIYDYVEEFCEHGLVLSNDYMLDTKIPVMGVDELSEYFKTMADYLYNASFMHTVLNKEYRTTDDNTPDLFIYGNEDGHDFIDSHRDMFDHWDASGHII